METVIAVIGGSNCTPGEAQIAYEVGQELARRGVTLLCGGLSGVMEAAARGATEAGGRTVGVLPGKRREDANPYIQLPIVTGMSYARNAIIVLSAQAVIAIGGAFGTLSEIAFALQDGTPVVGINTWELCRGGQPQDCLIPAQNAQEAVDKALATIARRVGER